MATETYSWSNQPTPPQGFSTSKTLVAPQTLPVPNQQTQSYATARTLVVPPAPAPQQGQGQWAPQSVPQPGGWPNLSAPQEWSSAPAPAEASRKPKRKGRGIVAWTLWVFAGGLFAAPQLADYADQAVEASVVWLAASAPGFVRPYLPKPIDAPASATLQQSSAPAPAPTARPSVAAPLPIEATPQPRRKPETVAQSADSATVVSPSLGAVATERPAKEGRPHPGRGKHGKVAAALAVAEDPAPANAKAAEPKHGANVDPFEGGDGAGESVPTRATKPTAEPTAQPAKPRESLDDLMAGGPSGDKVHDKRSTSKEIDAMLKGVQKSDGQPAPKKAEAVNANPPLTAAEIARAMSGVKSSAAECGRRSGESGVADLKVTVGRDGAISNVALRGRLADTPAGQCVVRAVRNAVFPHNSGLTFDYRIDVR